MSVELRKLTELSTDYIDDKIILLYYYRAVLTIVKCFTESVA